MGGRDDRSMKIFRLAEFPQHIDDVTRWAIEEWPDPQVAFAARRTRILDRPNCPSTLLAVSDRSPVGVLSFDRFQREGDAHLSLFIDVLFVHATARSLGVGTALLRAAVVTAATFEDELFVYTAVPAWYRDRGWVVRRSGPDNGCFVLSREVSPTAQQAAAADERRARRRGKQ